MFRHIHLINAIAALVAPWASWAVAGTVNPDISVIGQPFAGWSDAGADLARRRVILDVGETEVVFDADLNPYAHGNFVFALGEEGIALEEGYFLLTRGLPGGLTLKGGRYRAGFGRLNAVHSHAYPFAGRFGVLRNYLPGEESFNEIGVQVSELLALGGTGALTASIDWLQGDSFRIEREPGAAPNDPLVLDPADGDRGAEPRPAVLGRLAAFFPAGERSGIELGLSGTHGANNVAAGTQSTVFGADAKAKLWSGPQTYVVMQGEWLALRRGRAGWDQVAADYTAETIRAQGGYFFADWQFNPRYDAGASYERYQQTTSDRAWNQAFGLFAGVAMFEETTSFRIGFERLQPGRLASATGDPDAVKSLTVRVIYSMGPHKAHQF